MRLLAAALPMALGLMSVTAASQPLKFDVSSVRHNTGDDTISSARWFPGRFVAVNTRLDMLVTEAFEIPRNLADLMIAGGIRRDARCNRNCSSREDILSARFDIQATFPGEVPVAQRPAVLRVFLEDRFTLKTHVETENAPVYELTVAREGRLGPRLRPSSHNCGAWAKERSEAIAQGTPIPPSPNGADGKPLCGVGTMSRTSSFVFVWRGAGDISMLVANLRGSLPYILVDRTGLAGNYEWDLVSLIPGLETVPNVEQNAPALEDALQEQLGLRLARSRAPLQKLASPNASKIRRLGPGLSRGV